jgi:hypothetical protein
MVGLLGPIVAAGFNDKAAKSYWLFFGNFSPQDMVWADFAEGAGDRGRATIGARRQALPSTWTSPELRTRQTDSRSQM